MSPWRVQYDQSRWMYLISPTKDQIDPRYLNHQVIVDSFYMTAYSLTIVATDSFAIPFRNCSSGIPKRWNRLRIILNHEASGSLKYSKYPIATIIGNPMRLEPAAPSSGWRKYSKDWAILIAYVWISESGARESKIDAIGFITGSGSGSGISYSSPRSKPGANGENCFSHSHVTQKVAWISKSDAQ